MTALPLHTSAQRIGIQGELGSFSEEAAVTAFGAGVRTVSFRNNRDVTRELGAGALDAGVLPIENSLAGSVFASYDAILEEPGVHAVGQLILRINHCVVGLDGTDLKHVRIAESHPIALAQCSEFFEAHPWIHAVPSADTAGAARDVAASKDPTRVAIASASAAARYGLVIHARHVEDRGDNCTRFLLLSRSPAEVEPNTPVRTMLVYATRNAPGALLRTLEPLAERDINMVKIESRPAGTPWSYRFIVEFDHTGGAETARDAIAAIAPHTVELRHIGTFPLSA